MRTISIFAFVLFVVGLTPCLKYFSPSGVAATTCETGGFLVSNMIGVYKITSPSGRIYIGQSTNIEKRFGQYQRLQNVDEQRKLYNSFLKYGVETHRFEILEECDLSDLNRLERKHQDLSNCVSYGLNCFLTKTTDKSGVMGIESRQRLSIAHSGKKLTPEHRAKSIEILKNAKRPSGKDHWSFGKSPSAETRRKLSERQIGVLNHNYGKKASLETRAKLSAQRAGDKNPRFGKKLSKETIDKIQKARNRWCGPKGADHPSSKAVLDLKTGVFYVSGREAAFYNDIKYITLHSYLVGRNPNKTSLVYA